VRRRKEGRKEIKNWEKEKGKWGNRGLSKSVLVQNGEGR
jgi:hypothetical protein